MERNLQLQLFDKEGGHHTAAAAAADRRIDRRTVIGCGVSKRGSDVKRDNNSANARPKPNWIGTLELVTYRRSAVRHVRGVGVEGSDEL